MGTKLDKRYTNYWIDQTRKLDHYMRLKEIIDNCYKQNQWLTIADAIEAKKILKALCPKKP